MARETFRFLFAAAVYSLALFGLAALLSGCETGRALYHACRDGHCS